MTIFWVLLGLALLPVLLLTPRVRFSGSASLDGVSLLLQGLGFRIRFDSKSKQVRGRILGARVSPSLATQRDASPTAPVKEPEPVAEHPGVSPKLDKALIFDLVKRVYRLMRRLLRSVKAELIEVNLTVASSDPMNTAVVYGALQPVVMFNNPRRRFVIGVDFESEKPRFIARWKLAARPIAWIWIFFTWGVGLPWRRLWRLYRESRESIK
jgi:hypothetical protein